MLHLSIETLKERFQQTTDPDVALELLMSLYDQAIHSFQEGHHHHSQEKPHYPCIAFHIDHMCFEDQKKRSAQHAYGFAMSPGWYTTTVTQPRVFECYYREQLRLFMQAHHCIAYVGTSDVRIPTAFLSDKLMASRTAAFQVTEELTPLDLFRVNDAIVNGSHAPREALFHPLSLFTAERTDYSLNRLAHYTGTSPKHFQKFILLVNYQKYVSSFLQYGREKIGQEYARVVLPGNVIVEKDTDSFVEPEHLPQMPAYHLVRPDGDGITLINIGVGPSNAKTITDHLAVLRPYAWLMLGHCAGLHPYQTLGDYVLASAYVRQDHVLDDDLPIHVPIPPIPRIQEALEQAMLDVTEMDAIEAAQHCREGTVFSTDNRNWELRVPDVAPLLNISRAIALDMESATVAANGFRFRVPYGALLCISDKPLHGEVKLRSMANQFYKSRVAQHLQIGIRAFERMRTLGGETMHSPQLRGSHWEPAFR